MQEAEMATGLNFENHSFIDGDWFREVNLEWDGYSICLQVEEVLFHDKSQYQDILVFKSKSYGNVLVLNGIIQCTERDEFTYQEMITHIPMNLHTNPQRVLVVGGGDGGVVREILKYESVEEVVLCEIDQMVIDVCRKHLPRMAGSLGDPRVNIQVGDGVEYVRSHPGEFDIVITDAPDPEGAAEALFQKNFYKDLKSALKTDGIASCQGATTFTDIPFIIDMVTQCKEVFPRVGYATGNTPTYATGILGYLLASSIPDIDFTKPIRRLSDADLKRMNLKYYNSDIHTASFVLPNYARDTVVTETSSDPDIYYCEVNCMGNKELAKYLMYAVTNEHLGMSTEERERVYAKEVKGEELQHGNFTATVAGYAMESWL